jgi:predicted MFS family arabinose efflux permease
MGFLVALTAAFSIGHAYRTLPAVLAPALASDLALEPWALGVFGATFNVVFAAMQLPIGIALDRYDLRRVVVAILLVGALGATLGAASSSLPGLVLSQALIGVGCSGLWLSCCVHVGRARPPEQFAWITTICAALGSSGMFLTATPLAAVIERAHWRYAVVIVAVLTVILALVVALTPSTVATRPAGAGGPKSTMPILSLLRIPRLGAGVLLGLVSYGSLLAIRGLWIGPYLETAHQLTPTRAGNIVFVVSAIMIAMPFAFAYADRRGVDRRLIIAGAFTTAGAALSALGMLRPPLWLAATLLALYAGMAAAFILQYADARLAVPGEHAGRALSILNFAMLCGVAACQLGAGWLLAAMSARGDPIAGFDRAFALLGALLVAASIVYAVLGKRAASSPERRA